MNQYVFKSAVGFMTALMMSAAAQAATIWEPTDVSGSGNVNIIQFNIPGLSLNGGTLALFEDTDVAFSNPLALGSNGGIFAFTDNNNGTFSVQALVNNIPQGPALVMNGWEFSFGVNWGNGYVGDSGYIQDSGDSNTYLISFTDGNNAGESLAVDLTPVPLPAAAMLFGSALLGLVGIKRRKA
ncbi:MAG: hypothetical protein H6985_20470 [Pseudomonadales bacterium]|nr:hypothetical protein [Pseudomonadales bacterium]